MAPQVGFRDDSVCFERRPMSVVAGVDDTPVSALVVARGVEQARWRRTDLHVVHVAASAVLHSEVSVDWPAILEAHRKTVWERLEPAISASDVELTRIDLEGYPPDALVAYAGEVGASVLVVGTRGRGELASLVLGSTSHRAIQLAKCDVLVVKPPKEKT
jgi:nucleotide-binding universal stress UspA family protein